MRLILSTVIEPGTLAPRAQKWYPLRWAYAPATPVARESHKGIHRQPRHDRGARRILGAAAGGCQRAVRLPGLARGRRDRRREGPRGGQRRQLVEAGGGAGSAG